MDGPQSEVSSARILNESIQRLTSILEEQTALLRRRETRRELFDKSRQPIPEVPATSGSAWNALLRSTLTDAVQPKVDGWRSGLDALLVFLGLFSAIVTAFIIPSLGTLKQDEVARTNDLLANLTSIVLAINGPAHANLTIPLPKQFVPDPSDVRLNVYLTLSLVVSLAIAALAIACRGFVNLVAWSRHSKAVQRLTDIRIRWKAAEKLLGPTIESLPQLLVLPVLLFLLGLLDSLVSTALQISSPPVSILVAFGLSLFFVSGVALGLCYTIVDGSINPTTSPFQSRIAQVMNLLFVKKTQPVLRWIRRLFGRKRARNPQKQKGGGFASLVPSATTFLTSESMEVYHEVLQATGDDDILDNASAALFHIISQRTYTQVVQRRLFQRRNRLPVDLLPQECGTLLHLLSPEASTRSNRTAAQVMVRISSNTRARPLRYSQSDLGRLLPSLARAARRAASETGDAYALLGLWDSEFLRAMAILAHPVSSETTYPPAIVILSAPHWSWKYLASVELTQILALLFEMIDKKIVHALEDDGGPGGNADSDSDSDSEDGDAKPESEADAATIDSILGRAAPTTGTGANAGSPSRLHLPKVFRINPQDIIASLLYLPPDGRVENRLLPRMLGWLIRHVGHERTILAAQDRIALVQRPEWLHVFGPREHAMVPKLVAVLAERCLREGDSSSEFTLENRIQLAQLCTSCLLDTPSVHVKAPAGGDGLAFHARPLVRYLIAALRDVDFSSSLSASRELARLAGDVQAVMRFVEADSHWKEGKSGIVEELGRISARIGLHERPLTPGGAKYEAAEAGRGSYDGSEMETWRVMQQPA
ncbi:hypothetical protein C8F01DRAFT_1022191 [Mycena amicta]|nr:hypothetical protein C8F01DRAFT_1022191 [Mycena amicta]